MLNREETSHFCLAYQTGYVVLIFLMPLNQIFESRKVTSHTVLWTQLEGMTVSKLKMRKKMSNLLSSTSFLSDFNRMEFYFGLGLSK